MPTYSYRCKYCGNVMEKFASISSYPRKLECPVCHHKATLNISGGTGLIFKGTGFYITDYQRRKDNRKEDLKKKEKKETTK